MIETLSRRTFLLGAAAALMPAVETIIDLHQHTNYSTRSDERLIAHQQAMGITKTVLLPAGSRYGLDAQCGGNDSVVELTRRYPDRLVYFANELPDHPDAQKIIEKYLKAGAIGIGEQKFPVECDSEAMQRLARIAQEFGVPILMHFQHNTYNTGFERFHKMLEKFPKVNFIGHAQTWWGYIDRNHNPTVMYPKTKVAPGGITDRLLSDYPNIYGDLSAGSGLNALLRDEEHAREFLKRHQNKLIFGSDCNDNEGRGDRCTGARIIAAIKTLSPNAKATQKL